jgi:hypothetical protein
MMVVWWWCDSDDNDDEDDDDTPFQFLQRQMYECRSANNCQNYYKNVPTTFSPQFWNSKNPLHKNCTDSLIQTSTSSHE